MPDSLRAKFIEFISKPFILAIITTLCILPFVSYFPKYKAGIYFF